jgi:hypothetical protein
MKEFKFDISAYSLAKSVPKQNLWYNLADFHQNQPFLD